jgi:FG-GAP repeat
MKKIILFLIISVQTVFVSAQNVQILPTGITPAQGGGIDRLTTPARVALTNQNAGKLVFDIDKGHLYLWDGVQWKQVEDKGLDAVSTIVKTPSNSAIGDRFGYSCSVKGKWAVIGAFGIDSEEGEAYIFEQTENGWVQKKRLRADLINSSVATGDWFGYDVDIDVMTISGVEYPVVVVGSPYATVSGQTQAGKAYIFRYATVSSVLDWKHEISLTHPSPLTSDNFGWSVAIYNNKVIIGSPNDDPLLAGNPISSAGSASIFHATGSGTQPNATFSWAIQGSTGGQATLAEAIPTASHRFGYDVDISQNTYQTSQLITTSATEDIAVVGCHFSGNGDGFAKMYKNISGSWTLLTEFNTSDFTGGNTVASNSNIGQSVALDRGTLVIGAPRDNEGVNTVVGSILILRTPLAGTSPFQYNTAWSATPNKLRVPNPYASEPGSSFSSFGLSLDVAGGFIIVGALNYDGTITSSGFASVFNLSGILTKLSIPVGTVAGNIGFGTGISSEGNFVVGEARSTIAGKVHFGNAKL